MSITTKDKAGASVAYSFYRFQNGRTTLIGPQHSDASKDACVIMQRDPVVQKNDQGYRRTDAEFQQTVVISESTGDVKKLARVGINSSIPVGTPVLVIEELFARACEMAKQGTQRNDYFVVGVRPT